MRHHSRSAALFVAVVATGIGLPCFAEGDSERPLRFLGNASIAPIVWQNEGQAAGVAVDLAKAAAAKAGLKVQFEAIDWAEAQKQVLDGRADALIQINVTPERLQAFEFSDVLLESSFHLFRHADRVDIVDAASLKGKAVGVESAGLPLQLLKRIEGVRVTVIPSWHAGLERVSTGDLDAVLVDRWVGEFALTQKRIKDIVVIDPPLERSQSRIAVRKGNFALLARLNDGLRQIDADGTRKAILARWEAKEVVYLTRERLNHWIVWSIAAAATLLAALSGWLFIQGRRARQLNRELEAAHAVQQSAIAEREAALNSPAISVVRTRQRRFVWANQSFLRLFGYEAEELIGLSTRILYSDDEAWKSSPGAKLGALIAGEAARSELQLVRKDGTRVWADVTITKLASHEDELFIAIVDMSEQRRAREALALSERQLRIASTAGGIGLWILNRSTGEAWRSDRHREIFGDAPDDNEWSLETMIASLVAEDQERVRKAILGTHEGQPIDWRARIRRKDGELRWIEAKGEIVRSSDGKEASALGSVVDVTDQVSSLEAIERSERRFQLASRAGKVGVFEIDARRGWRSPVLAEIFGDSPTDTDWSIERFVGRVRTDHREAVRLAFESAREPGQFEVLCPVRRPDGQERWLRARFTRSAATATQGALHAGTVEDVTEDRARESQLAFLAQVLQSMREGVCLARVGSREIVYANERFDALFGYGPGDLIGRDMAILNAATEEDPKAVAYRIMAECEKRGAWEGDVLSSKMDGTKFWTHASISRLYHPDFGDVWVSVQGDVDARKRLEKSAEDAASSRAA